MKYTKIIATLADRHCEPEFVASLYKAGMNVVRINSAHISIDGFRMMVENVRKVSNEIAIMIDTKGPEIRTTAIADGIDRIAYNKGDHAAIYGDPARLTTKDNISVNYVGMPQALSVGDVVLIDDGEMAFSVTACADDHVDVVANNTGFLGSRKTVNVPGVRIDLPSVTERDREFIREAAALDVDFIAHSFVRTIDDVAAVQRVLDECGSDIKIIAKIENQEGVDNFDSILEACYGIMIARGDLGIEIAAERIPAIQRMIISKCIASHSPVIVATQMLHSMINNPRPTRAEVTDVAEAVYQQADAVMLSGETASGKYPVEAVETMARIAHEVELTLAKTPKDAPILPDTYVTSFLARQAVMSEIKVGTKAIVTDSYHGRTARFISSFRGSQPVFAICNREVVVRRLALSYGVMPYYSKDYTPDERYPHNALRQIIEEGRLNAEDRIAYLGSFGGTAAAFLEINRVCDILDSSDH